MTIRKFTCCSLLLFLALQLKSQDISVSFPDTITYGAATTGNVIDCWINDWVTNLSPDTLLIDVIRVQNDTATPGWESSFCFQYCNQTPVDSVRATLQPNEAVNIAIHFNVTNIPDSGSVLMEYRNVNNPAEAYYQRFYAFTSPAGVHETQDGNLSATCYPTLIGTNELFTIHIPATNNPATEFTLAIFDISGRQVASTGDLHTGENTISADLAPGTYTWMIFSADGIAGKGKIIRVP